MISSKSNMLWIVFSILGFYFGLVTNETYLMYGMPFFMTIFVVFFFIDKRCENMTLDVISELYAKNKQIDIKELSNKRSCGFTQNDLKFFNYYKRKGLIPFDAELVDPDGYSPHTFE